MMAVLVEGARLIVCRVSLLDSRCSSNIIVKVVSPEASGSRSNFKVGGVKGACCASLAGAIRLNWSQ